MITGEIDRRDVAVRFHGFRRVASISSVWIPPQTSLSIARSGSWIPASFPTRYLALGRNIRVKGPSVDYLLGIPLTLATLAWLAAGYAFIYPRGVGGAVNTCRERQDSRGVGF